MPSGKRLCLRITAVLLVCFVGQLTHADPPRLPDSSFGYVHFDLKEIRKSSQFESLFRILSRVDLECSEYSIEQLGFDFNSATSVTVVFPPIGTIMQSGPESFCVVAKFTEAFDADVIVRRLGAKWQVENYGRATLHRTDPKNSFHFASNDTIVFGSTETVAWWANAKSDPDVGIAFLFNNSIGSGELQVGFDLGSVPEQLFAALPEQARFVGKADYCSLDVWLGEELEINAYLHYDEESVATNSVHKLRALKKQGRNMISSLDVETKKHLNDKNVSANDRMGALVMLAALREGADLLKKVEISRDGSNVETSLEIDQGLIVLTSSLAALGAMGEEDLNSSVRNPFRKKK